MSEDRLKELLRQRALLAEHVAWLDREIAGVQATGRAAATPVPIESPSTAATAPTPTFGQPRALPPTPPVPAADVDALFDRLQTEEKSRGQFSKQGCWLVFTVLMVIGLVGIAALVFFRYR